MDETPDQTAGQAESDRFARRFMWVVVAAVFAVSAWVVLTPNKGSDLEKALCDDLGEVYNVGQIRGDTDPERFAQTVYGAVKDVCPEHADRKDVQVLLEAWGLG